MKFETGYEEILAKISTIDPVAYSKTRNYRDGAITYLSPYISRGVISTKLVAQNVWNRGLPFYQTEKLIQELAWRDYWQQVWIAKKKAINNDLLSTQTEVRHKELPIAINRAETGIEAIDRAISDLYANGYMHNHMRMYVASLACNVGKSHWKIPAKWMYYHLLDGDWASNALSWQWVAGTNAKKKYYANQENINNFFYSTQEGTFLDVSYEELRLINCPEILQTTEFPALKPTLPATSALQINPDWSTLIYNYYNLDPLWRKEEKVNRIFLLEPSVFEEHPVSQKCIDFVLELLKNISGIQIYVGEFSELITQYKVTQCIFKEHPLNQHYAGLQDERDWIFPVTGYYPSFFAYWKKCKKATGSWQS